MKFAAVLALAVGSAQAANFQTTLNECWDDEGATHLGKCFDLFYRYCDEYEIGPEQTCNVHTFSRSSVKYLTTELDVIYWVFIKTDEEEEIEITPVNDNDFDDFSSANGAFNFKAKLQAHEPEELDPDEEPREDPFENGCVKEAEIPSPYNKGNAISLQGLQCALRYQIVNKSELGTYKFSVGRDSAAALSTAVASLYAILAF